MKTCKTCEFWLSIWIIVGIVVCVGMVSIAAGICINNKIAFDRGYERGSLPGVQYAEWVKAD